MFCWQKKSLTLFLVTLLGACAAPPPKPMPSSAASLAQEALQTPNSPQLASEEDDIATLPAEPSPVLRQINQAGSVPGVQNTVVSPPDLNKMGDDKVKISLNADQIPLQQLLEEVADSLALSIVIDPTISDKVTVRTPPNKDLTKRELWSLLQLLITDAGISLERKGNVYHAKKIGSSLLPNNIGIRHNVQGSDQPEIMQITPLRYITTEAALAIVKPLVEPQGRILALPNVNTIGIITSPERLQKVNSLLTLIDADPFKHRGMRLFRLGNSKASDLKQDLEGILKAIAGSQPAYQILSLERINALLVISPPGAGFKQVELWIDILDEPTEASGEQIFIYQARHVEAKELATTLSDVFKQDNNDDLLRRQQDEKKDEKQGLPKQLPLNAADNQAALQKEQAKTDSKTQTNRNRMAVSAELKINVVADENTNSLIVRATPRDYKQLLETIYQLDQVPKEVMINVVIAEVELTEANIYGIDWKAILDNDHGSIGNNFNIPEGNFPDDVAPSDDAAPQQVGGLTGFTLSYISSSLNALLNFIASKTNLSVLSRPSILVRNHEEASINIGSSEPVLSRINTSTSTDNQLSTDVQYRDTGITLKVTPRINNEGVISMKVYQEVSQVGPERTTQNLQSFSQRKVETTVVVRDGTAIVFGGLIETNIRDTRQNVPGLSKIPLLGDALFSSAEQSQDRTELVLIMVPKIVDPYADNSEMVNKFKQRMSLVTEMLQQYDFASDFQID